MGEKRSKYIMRKEGKRNKTKVKIIMTIKSILKTDPKRPFKRMIL
jgi:hypothetical protein